MDKKYFGKPSFMTSIVEESWAKDSKTLSDGGVESDADIKRIETELPEIAETIEITNKENEETPVKDEGETVIESECAKSERSTENKSESIVETRPPPSGGVKRPESGISRTVNMIGHLGGLEEGKLSGEVVEWMSHPAVIVICIFLACLHSLTGLDLLTVFGIIITVIAFVSLIIQ